MSKENKIVDRGRVYAAELINKYIYMLIHLEDLVNHHGFYAPGLYRDVGAFSNNIWAALVAIVKGHESFEPYQSHGMSAALDTYPAPMDTLENLVITEAERFNSLVTSAGKFVKEEKYASLKLMDVSPLLELIQEVPKLKEIYIPPKNTLEYKKISAQQIPSFLKFKFAFEDNHNKGIFGLGILQTNGLFGKKGLGILKAARATTMSKQLEKWGVYFTIEQVIRHARSQDPHSRTKEILKNLGIQYDLTKSQISSILNQQKFLAPVLWPIVLEYLDLSYIRIMEDNSQKYLDEEQVSSLKFGA